MSRWYWDHKACKCEQFTYGGCQSNGNNFETNEICLMECGSHICIPDRPVPAVCKREKFTGPCRASILRWYFDHKACECKQFTYGGCQSNGNNFQTKKMCQTNCGSQTCIPDSTEPNVCRREKFTGPCRNSMSRWYWDHKACKCEQFTYGGCQSNGNNFETNEICLMECGSDICVPDRPVPAVCKRDKFTGPCRASMARWYWDHKACECKQFTYGGCQSNGNNFQTNKMCLTNCGSRTCIPDSTEPNICKREKFTGPCRASMSRWYWEHKACQCKQFTYGGCNSNGNNFETREVCQIKCGSQTCIPDSTEPNVCKREKFTGPCRASMSRWYWDRKACDCKQFTYGGCQSNGNNFQTKEACLTECEGQTCIPDTTEPNVCKKEKFTGPCQASMARWYWDHKACECKQFTYGGCQSNGNNFETREVCQIQCGSQTCIPDSTDPAVCKREKFTGPCRASLPRWYWDHKSCECKQFTYGGCQSNGNNFETREVCQIQCGSQTCIPSSTEPNVCKREKFTGPCRASMPRWYWDHKACECKQFTYGGCQSNGNNFQTKEVCLTECESQTCIPDTTEPNVCKREKFTGPCFASIPRWHWDHKGCECKQFTYGGCQSNGNNFETREVCQIQCGSQTCIPDSTDPAVCKREKFTGPCRASLPRWYWDHKSCECKQFTYGGCQSNGNNFETREVCQIQCGSQTCIPSSTEPNVCKREKFTGPCRASMPRWYWDHKACECKQFTYGGCQSNGNNFQTKEVCLTECESQTCIPDTTEPNVCKREKFTGPCFASIPRWHWDHKGCECKQFTYGGCQSNGNNFETREVCQIQCGSQTCIPDSTDPAVCKREKFTGPCRASLPRWYWDHKSCECKQFTYGGCQSNGNNFETREVCQIQCGSQTCIPNFTEPNVCKREKFTGPCRASMPRWYWDHKACECKQFTYGGCQSNGNNFQTKEVCLTECESQTCIPDTTEPTVCKREKFTGPCRASMSRWYWDHKGCECKQFTYGGCQSNGNNFETREVCQIKCSSHTCIPDSAEPNVCKREKFTGPCRASMPRWYWDHKECECKQFTYGGCQSNGNNFETKTECKIECGNLPCTRGSEITDLCMRPKHTGRCFADFSKWYWNKDSCSCERFTYGGCGSNGNNFRTKEACAEKCGGSPCLA